MNVDIEATTCAVYEIDLSIAWRPECQRFMGQALKI